MKKIVPFNKVLKFNKNILEINSISLEHKIYDMGDSISGEFNILGEYILDNGSKEIENFDYKLPFDIALGVNYDRNNMVVDIDDFRYEIISSDEVRVDIDLYIDGEEIIERNDSGINKEDTKSEEDNDTREEPLENDILDNIEIENNIIDENINNNDANSNKAMNILENISNKEEYYTYRVYTVAENDTIDTILAKYNITLEEIKKYNDISNIKPLDKLIIPSNEE